MVLSKFYGDLAFITPPDQAESSMYWHVEGRFCCHRCFDYPWLKQFVKEKSERRGSCGYCNSSNVHLVPVASLSGYFINLLNLYRPSSNHQDESLSERFQFEWQIFRDKWYENHTRDAERLLDDIFYGAWDDDSGDVPIDSAAPYTAADYRHLTEAPEQFRDLVERQERLARDWRLAGIEPETSEMDTLEFPRQSSDQIKEFVTVVAEGATLYRARLGSSGSNERGVEIPWSGV